MNMAKLFGAVLIIAGLLGLVFNTFSYTKDSHETSIGPVSLSVKEKEDVFIPTWASVGVIVIGGLLLVFGNKRP
jgi:uncharacterized membrane protein